MSILRRVLIATSISFLAGCGDDPKDVAKVSEMLFLISQNQAVWTNQQIKDYEFTYERTSVDCPIADPYPAVVITVKNSLVTSVYVPTLGTYNQDISSWPTIDGIFEKLNSVAIANPKVFAKNLAEPNVTPVFNAKYGFPVELVADQSDANCDGFSYQVSNFK